MSVQNKDWNCESAGGGGESFIFYIKKKIWQDEVPLDFPGFVVKMGGRKIQTKSVGEVRGTSFQNVPISKTRTKALLSSMIKSR